MRESLVGAWIAIPRDTNAIHCPESTLLTAMAYEKEARETVASVQRGSRLGPQIERGVSVGALRGSPSRSEFPELRDLLGGQPWETRKRNLVRIQRRIVGGLT